MINKQGIVYTFYSFKGGTGRSMALANVASLLAKAGSSVLIIDWDLEAPGIEKYFSGFLSSGRDKAFGIVDIAHSIINNENKSWDESLLYAKPFSTGRQISILTAGRDDEGYFERLQSINWETIFSENGFGSYLEKLRGIWKSRYDYILIDSRTGVTDTGGICTLHLPDILVFLFTANEQSVQGVANVVKRILTRHKTLPLDRAQLLSIPLPSRFETVSENNLSAQWKGVFAETFFEQYEGWMPKNTNPIDIIDKLTIPYVPFWSFGEGLPVVSEGTNDPRSIGYSYNILARLIGFKLDWERAIQGELALTNDANPKTLNDSLENFYNSLSDREKFQVKKTVLRFVFLDYANEDNDTTRKVKLKFLRELTHGAELLLEKQILSRDFNSLTGEPELEITNRSIIKDWKRFSLWIRDDRDFLIWRQDLALQAERWDNSSRDRDFLMDRKLVKNGESMISDRRNDLNELEKAYINKSRRLTLYSYVRYYGNVNVAIISILLTITTLYSIIRPLSNKTREQDSEKMIEVYLDSIKSYRALLDSTRQLTRVDTAIHPKLDNITIHAQLDTSH